jgi:putative PEP-CTERM system TPR-repeat lipoprotein
MSRSTRSCPSAPAPACRTRRTRRTDRWTALGVAAALALAQLAGCAPDTPQDLVASAQAYLDKRDPRAAIVQLKAALQQDPNSGLARYLLGRALLDSGDPGSAIVELGKAQDLRHADRDVVPALARALLLSGQYRRVTTDYASVQLADKAAMADLQATLAAAWGAQGDRERTEQAVAAALALVPEHGPARVLQARMLAGARRYGEALALVQQVLAREDTLHDAWHLLGELLWYVQKDEKGATEAFRRALALEKAYVPAHSALISLAIARRDVDAMKAQLGQLREVLPKHPQTRFVEAQIAFVQRDYARAREITQALLRVAPDHAGTLQMAGAIEFQNGSLLLAETHLNKALQQAPQLPVARRLLGQTYLRLGQPQRTLAVLEPMISGEGADAEAISVAADAFLQLAQPGRAEALFLRAAELAPGDARVRTALALTHLARGDADTAFSELEAVAARDKGSFADMALISARLKRGEYAQALAAVDAMSKKQPDTALVAMLRGRIHQARGDGKAARAELERALAIDPMYFPAAASLAQLDVAAKRPEDSIPRFEAMVRTDPRHVNARLAIADLRLRAGAPREQVAALLAEAIKLAPAEAAPRLALVDLHLRAKDFKAALAVAQDASAALPSNLDVMDALGRAQFESGDLQQALNTFRRLAGASPNTAQTHLRLADLHLALRDPRAAEASFRRALEAQPDSQPAQRGLVNLALADKRPRDALAVARTMQQQRPHAAAGWLFEADIQQRLKNPTAAIAAYRNGLRQRPHPELAARLHAALLAAGQRAEADRLAAEWDRDRPGDPTMDQHLAGVAITRGDFAQAEQRLARVVERQPDNALALNNLAWLMVRQGRSGAVPLAERANELLPGRPPLMDTLAGALAAEKQWQRALALQKEVVERAPEDFYLRLNLARIAIQAGDKELARSELEKIARHGGRSGLQADAAQLLKTL